MTEKFKDEIFSNILKSIRQTGEYIVNKNKKEKINDI